MNKTRRRLARHRRRARAACVEVRLRHPFGVDDRGRPIWWIGDRLVTENGRAWTGHTFAADSSVFSNARVGDVVELRGARYVIDAVLVRKEGSAIHTTVKLHEFHRIRFSVDPNDLDHVFEPIIEAARKAGERVAVAAAGAPS